jgi:hypothetical protein
MGTRYDKRIDQLEGKIGEAGKLPPSARGPFIVWPDPGEKADFSEIENELMRKYRTVEGAKFIEISWGKATDEKALKNNMGIDGQDMT